jgi:hypothetical protein
LHSLKWFNGGMAIENWTPFKLRQAAELKEQIEALELQLEAVLGGKIPSPVDTAEETQPVKAKRGGPAKIQAEQPEKKARRKISKAGRAAMAAAAKARWAKAKAAKAA